MDQFRAFVSYYTEMEPSEFELALPLFTRKRIKKDRHILRAGAVCEELVYIDRGCFRVYKKDREKETNIWFSLFRSGTWPLTSELPKRR